MAIDELHVSGELAFMRSYIRVRVSPPGTGVAVERAGYTLSLFRKVQGRWLLARDANLLTIVPT